MLRGFNSDITAKGRKYHVQTEDWGSGNPYLVTRIFRDGAVIKTLKVSYEDALKSASVRSAEGLKQALQKQHSDIIDALLDGRLL